MSLLVSFIWLQSGNNCILLWYTLIVFLSSSLSKHQNAVSLIMSFLPDQQCQHCFNWTAIFFMVTKTLVADDCVSWVSATTLSILNCSKPILLTLCRFISAHVWGCPWCHLWGHPFYLFIYFLLSIWSSSWWSRFLGSCVWPRVGLFGSIWSVKSVFDAS